MRFLICVCLFVNVVFVFSSCSYKQDQVLFEQKEAAQADSNAQKNTLAINDYKIKPQDILQVQDLQNYKYLIGDVSSDNSSSNNNSTNAVVQTYQVEEDSSVALPILGRVAVAGLTRLEATKKIEDLYRAKGLKNPIIEVKIVNLKVTVLGEIKSQGNYPLTKDKTTLVEIIGEAGGLTDRANQRNIKIIRGSGANPTVTIIDMSKLESLNDPATLLKNGDVISIAQNKQAIRTNKLIDFSTILQPALIILNTALIIFTLAHH